jgi:hypothetical protein
MRPIGVNAHQLSCAVISGNQGHHDAGSSALHLLMQQEKCVEIMLPPNPGATLVQLLPPRVYCRVYALNLMPPRPPPSWRRTAGGTGVNTRRCLKQSLLVQTGRAL